MQRRLILATPFLILAGRAGAQAPETRPLVVASFSILGDMVMQLAGDRVRLRTIAGPNADAHTFQPRPSDAAALRGAALVVRNGLGFDSWFDRMLRAGSYRGKQAVATAGITPRPMAGHERGHGHGHERGHGHGRGAGTVPDPHAWQDLRHGIAYVRTIAAALAAAGVPDLRTEDYVARLTTLESWVRAEIGSVPEARRRIVTSHDAFGYFGDAYGVQFLAPQGISTEAEPSAAEVARLIRLIREQGITAVFLENMGNPATLNRLAREAGVTVQGRLFADALSAADGPAPSYEAMFRHNVTLMVRAMKGAGA
jgi:zinc/manganese transport system substrate-binding protein